MTSSRNAGEEAAALQSAVAHLLDTGGAPNLVMQPIVDVRGGEVVGYEVLSRFAGPPNATPDRWFNAACAMGRGVELEVRVFEKALRLRTDLPPNTFLTLNVAPEALLDERLQRVLDGCSMQGTVFELTEHSAVADYDLLGEAIRHVKSLGGFVAVDDAGAGYSSLSHILQLRPDFIKLDRSLIEGVHRSEAKSALVEMFGAFASRIDAWILAEGIEEPEELVRVVQLGVPLVQGYLLGKPAPAPQTVPEKLAQLMQNAGTGRDQLTVDALCEPVSPVREPSSDSELMARVLASDHFPFVVVVNELHRPLTLVTQGASGPLSRRLPMCVIGSTSISDAIQRALTRAVHARFDPLVCCTEDGRYVGLVRVDRLVERLVFPPSRKLSWTP